MKTITLSAVVLLLAANAYSQGIEHDNTFSRSSSFFGRTEENAASFGLQQKPYGRSYDRWLVALGGGFGYRTGKMYWDDDGTMPEVIKSFRQKLRSGFVLDGSITYFLNQRWGLGLQASRFTSSENSYLSNIEIEGMSFSGDLSQEIAVSIIGPAVTYRKIFARNQSALLFSAAVVYTDYVDQLTFNGKVKATGNYGGYSAHVGYDFPVLRHISLGVKASALYGYLPKMTINNEPKDLLHGENLSRIEIGLGIRYRK